MDKKEYYSPFEWTTDILITTAIFKLCNFFRYPKGQKFHAYGQRGRLVWHGYWCIT